MTGLIDAAFTRTRVVVTALVVLVLFGIASFRALPREADPNITAPFVMVTMPLPGISPEDGERLLVKPTEIELQTIEGLLQIDSIAFDGLAQIILEFEVTIDIDQAVLDVREAVDRAKSEYPADAEEPIITEFNLQNEFPLITTMIYGQAPERLIYQTARDLEDRLASVPGVLEARLTGSREELLEVIVDPRILESYGLTEIEVINAVTSNNQLVTAGSVSLEAGRFAIKAPGLVKDGRDLMAVPLRVNGDNVVTIGDVAEVRRTFKDRTGYALFNGEPAIGVEITKRADANIIKTIEAAREVVDTRAALWPSSIKYNYVGDQSVFVRDSLSGLTGSVITAILLVMIVVVGALGLRSGLMVGVAIPTTFLIGFALLGAFGFTLNMMVMFGLILAVGMLVDGAIVIVEYADRRMAEGAPRETAYAEASKRMFWPVITSTATTLAAFVPFLFWNDIPGEFMRYLPLTMIFVLSSSLLVALVFLPVLGSLLGMPSWLKQWLPKKEKTSAPIRSLADEIDPTTTGGFIAQYAKFLKGLVQRPLLVIVAAFAIVWICLTSFRLASPDVEFFIRTDDELVNIFVLGRGNLSEDQKIAIVNEVTERVADHESIESIYIQTGRALSRNPDIPADTIGQIGIDLVSYSERIHSRLIVEEFRKRVHGVPGVLVEVRQRESGPPVGKDVQIEISGGDFDEMIAAAKKAREFLDTAHMDINGRSILAFMDAEDTLPLPGIEWSMDVDRELAGRYGLSVAQAGAVVQFVTDGLLIDKYRPDDAEEEVDIRIRYPEKDRSVLALDQIRIQTMQGSVPLSNFVTREAKPQVDRIVRRNGERIIEVKANGNTSVPGYEVGQNRAIDFTKEWLETGALGQNVTWIMRGADEETADASAFFATALMAAMFLIAMILLLEFNNFYHAALTLSSVVLSVIGVLAGIAITGQYVSILMTGTGLVALAGIVVNNNIVLIDTYQYLRRKGLAAEEAVIRTAAQRFRPVVLTTATTILGLLPMVFEINVNFAKGAVTHGSSTSSMWVLLSSAVVYGLAFSTLLTLILTPVMLATPAVIQKRLPAVARIVKAGWNRLRPANIDRLQPSHPQPPTAASDVDIPRAAE